MVKAGQKPLHLCSVKIRNMKLYSKVLVLVAVLDCCLSAQKGSATKAEENASRNSKAAHRNYGGSDVVYGKAGHGTILPYLGVQPAAPPASPSPSAIVFTNVPPIYAPNTAARHPSSSNISSSNSGPRRNRTPNYVASAPSRGNSNPPIYQIRGIPIHSETYSAQAYSAAPYSTQSQSVYTQTAPGETAPNQQHVVSSHSASKTQTPSNYVPAFSASSQSDAGYPSSAYSNVNHAPSHLPNQNQFGPNQPAPGNYGPNHPDHSGSLHSTSGHSAPSQPVPHRFNPSQSALRYAGSSHSSFDHPVPSYSSSSYSSPNYSSKQNHQAHAVASHPSSSGHHGINCPLRASSPDTQSVLGGHSSAPYSNAHSLPRHQYNQGAAYQASSYSASPDHFLNLAAENYGSPNYPAVDYPAPAAYGSQTQASSGYSSLPQFGSVHDVPVNNGPKLTRTSYKVPVQSSSDYNGPAYSAGSEFVPSHSGANYNTPVAAPYSSAPTYNSNSDFASSYPAGATYSAPGHSAGAHPNPSYRNAPQYNPGNSAPTYSAAGDYPAPPTYNAQKANYDTKIVSYGSSYGNVGVGIGVAAYDPTYPGNSPYNGPVLQDAKGNYAANAGNHPASYASQNYGNGYPVDGTFFDKQDKIN